MNVRIQTYGEAHPMLNLPYHWLASTTPSTADRFPAILLAQLYFRTLLTYRSSPEGTAIEALEKGLRDLQDLCDVVGDKYWAARNQYVAAAEA